MSRHIGQGTLGQRVAAREQLLTPVWIRDSGRHVPGVLLDWEKRDGSWWGLVAWDPGSGLERVWVPGGRLTPIAAR